MEKLTDDLYAEALSVIEEVEELGGMTEAINSGLAKVRAGVAQKHDNRRRYDANDTTYESIASLATTASLAAAAASHRGVGDEKAGKN